MKAIFFTEYGSPDVLRLKEIEKPAPKDDEVLIKVHAASVNDWDWCLVRGTPFYNRLLCGLLKPKVNIPGVDIAGRVEAVGENVTRLEPGDEVYGDLSESGFGGFAEYVCAPETALSLKSAGMTFIEAAAIPHAALLALQGLRDVGQLRSGQRVLINGAGGGVGTLGVQIAKFLGAGEVTGVDNSGKLEMMSSLGCDQVIDYTKVDFTKNGQRYDLILDTKTNRSVFEYARALGPDGTYVTVGGDTARLFQSYFLGPIVCMFGKKKIRVVALKPNKDLDTMNGLFEAGKVKPVIDGPYRLSEAPQAIRHFGEGSHKGKIVITLEHSDSTEQFAEVSSA